MDDKYNKLKMNDKYNNLFDKDSKAEAFDEIAAVYYDKNFGTMPKSDFEVLMFSLYIERAIENSDGNMASYSDYRLSKELGITQSKIENLKVRKQLRYPRDEDDWKQVFIHVCQNMICENGKIKIHIPDKNVYIEVKNAIEEKGGFVDTQLNSKLLQTTPQNLLKLMLRIYENEDRKEIEKIIKAHIKKNNAGAGFIEGKSIDELLSDLALDITVEMAKGVVEACVPIFGKIISGAITTVKNKISNRQK